MTRQCTSCSALHSHPTRPDCTRCSGWACACGRPKPPERESCGRPACKGRVTRAANRREQEKRTADANVVRIDCVGPDRRRT